MQNNLLLEMIPERRYNVTLNNLQQKGKIVYRIATVPSGPRHHETWTCSIMVDFYAGTTYLDPPIYVAQGWSKGEALNIASYFLLTDFKCA
ncbi:hypothetical protein FRB93_011923 [Tulasnella sp. JGI-2019a]|nr:hypothetical protein FRB93_011923 [Tulasnella sp. JGI-2019a]